MSAKMKNQLKCLDGTIQLIRHAKYRICHQMCPQNEVFKDFENEALEKCGFLDILKNSHVVNEKSVLSCALESYGSLFDTLPECHKLIKDFADTLGSVSSQVQEEKCDFYISCLNEIYTKQSKVASDNSKLYRSMGLLVGITVAILLL